MRIHRLRVERIKGVDASELTFPETGVVIIEGPNEVGKSTLLEALDRLLDPKAKASSRAASITSLQPVGQDVGPYVEAELSIGPYRLVFAKQWLKQPATTLQIMQPVAEQLTGQDAQARMTSILDECLDRTLFDALRLAQAGSPGAIELGDSAVLEAALDAAAGAAMHADEGAALLEAVEREYQRYYTAATGRVSGELREARATLAEAEQHHEQAQFEVVEVERVFARREVLASELVIGQERVRMSTLRVHDARNALAAVKALRAEEVAAQQALLGAEQAHQRAVEGVQVRAALVSEVASRAEQARQRHERVAQLARACEDQAVVLSDREAALVKAAEDDARGQREAEDAAAAAGAARSEVKLATLADRVATARALSGELSRVRAELEACAVTDVVLEELRRRDIELHIARARAEASATSIRVSAPENGHSIELSDEVSALDPGHDAVERFISADVSLLVDSAVRIEIRPDAQARERVARRDELAEALAGHLSELDVADLAEAEAEGRRHRRIVAHATDLQRELVSALGDQTLEELRAAHLSETERGRAATAPASASARERPGNDPQDCLRRAEQREEAARLALPQLSSVHVEAKHAVDGARAQSALATAARESMQAQLDDAVAEQRRSEATLADARRVDPDERLADHAGQAEDVLGRARDTAAQIRATLAAEGVRAREDEEREANSEQSQVSASLEAVRDEFFEIKGRLEQVAAEGRQEAVERADQALGDARRRYASVERRAMAAQHLRSALQRHRDRAHLSYAEPYARQIDVLGQQVYGDSFGVTVSPDLVITHRRLDGDIVPFESLSGGAKEQLGILARLAVAALVAGHQSVPVVVDDALGYTDPQRLRSLSAVLARGSGQGQLVLLTCTPDRYADISGAHTIRMTA